MSNEEYNQGYREFFEGKLRNNNPYEKYSKEYKEWDNGWCDGSIESDEALEKYT